MERIERAASFPLRWMDKMDLNGYTRRGMHNLIQIGTMRFPRRINPMHTHDAWEMVYYLSGSGVSNTAREHIPFSAGTLIAYPPHTEHDEVSRGTYASYWLTFDRFAPASIMSMTDDAHGSCRALLGIICREYLRKGSHWRITCDSALDVLLSILSDRIRAPKRPPHVQAMEYAIIDSIHDGDFSAKRAFAAIGMSQHYLIRSFKRAFGVSPVQYRIDIQMRDAERLLTVTDLSVREIAKQLGFRDAYYFSRLFKRKCGVSPMAYRSPSARKGNAD